MNLLRIFHLGARGILAKNHSVPGIVTRVRKSCLYVIKKPVRLMVTEQNTRFSHYITFTYSVNGIPCTGILWLSPQPLSSERSADRSLLRSGQAGALRLLPFRSQF